MIFNNRDTSSFPTQKLSIKEKSKKWREGCVDGVIGREGGLALERDKMKTAYDLYNGIFNEEDLKYVTNPYKVDDSFPATLQNFNIIRPKINLLLGEESKRPNNIMVYQTNEEAVSILKDKMKTMLSEAIVEEIYTQMEGAEQDQGFEEKINGIINYVTSDYVNPAEITAHSTLEYLRQKLDIDYEMMKGFKDGLISGKEIHYQGIVNGEPMTERVNPLEFAHDNDPDMDNIEDGDWAARHMKMTPTAIYDRFNDFMTESQLNEVLKLSEGGGGVGKMTESDYARIDYKVIDSSSARNDATLQGTYLDVWHVVWRSFKKVGFLTWTDETGEEQTDMVSESYIVNPGEEIKWDWITEIWEGYRIGDDIYAGIAPLPYQMVSMDNPNNAKLPYIGSLYSDTNSTNMSLIDIMKPLAYMYIIVWYRIELALSRDKGKVINMDITQIPKSMGVDVNKWLHYLSAIGVNLINPYEEGWDIPGREGGRPAAFNQMTQMDLSMTNIIAGYIEMLDKIEDMIGELSGVSRARQGQIHQSELVGNVERKVIQSSHITESLFYVHGNIKKRVYTMLLNIAKFAWRDSNKKNLYYILDDTSRKFVDINDDFLYSDFDVFVTDSTKEAQNIEALKSLMQAGMQNGATLLDAAYILTSDNMNQIKRKLEEIEKKRQEMEAQVQEQQNQIQQQAIQAQQQQIAAEATFKQEELRIKEDDSIRKSETELTIARMNLTQDAGETAADPEKTSLERQKVQLQAEKINKDYDLKARQLSEVARKDRVAEDLKRQEIEIKKKVANKPVPKSK